MRVRSFFFFLLLSGLGFSAMNNIRKLVCALLSTDSSFHYTFVHKLRTKTDVFNNILSIGDHDAISLAQACKRNYENQSVKYEDVVLVATEEQLYNGSWNNEIEIYTERVGLHMFGRWVTLLMGTFNFA